MTYPCRYRVSCDAPAALDASHATGARCRGLSVDEDPDTDATRTADLVEPGAVQPPPEPCTQDRIKSYVSPPRHPLPEPLRNPVVRLLLLAVDALGLNLEHDVARKWFAEQLDGHFRPVAPLVALLLRRALAPSLG